MSWNAIAAKFAVSDKTARRSARTHEEAIAAVVDGAREQVPNVPRIRVEDLPERVGDLPVEDLFVDVINTHIDAMRELGEILEEGGHAAARVGAVKARTAAGVQLVGLLAQVGLMPNADSILIARALARRARGEARAQADRLLVEEGA